MNHINNTENENRISMKPIEKKSLYLKISDAIYRYIQMNNLQPGDKLPSERDMSAMLQTSRNSVREALRILEDRGLIYVKQGVVYLLIILMEKIIHLRFSLLTVR